MPCYSPILAWRGNEIDKVFIGRPNSNSKKDVQIMYLPCGKCLGCRLEYSRQWAIRCVHEAQLHLQNCFLTLTYDEDHLPLNGSLVKKDLQDFFKRLRSKLDYSCEKLKIPKIKVKYFACGEYGDHTLRPHYHVILFGYRPPDMEIWQRDHKKGSITFTSKIMDSIWQNGRVIVGNDVNFETCAYVARYVVKKYKFEVENAEFFEKRIKSYIVCSRRPAIGRDWYARYNKEVSRKDQVSVRGGFHCKPPRYYDKLLAIFNPEKFEEIKKGREEFIKQYDPYNELQYYADLEKAEVIKQAATKGLLIRQ